MTLPPLLSSLLTTHGPSGYESRAGRRSGATRRPPSATRSRGDVMGSSTARVAGTGGGPSLAIVGHIDEIGLIVTHIEDSGFLRFIGVGGWDPQILIGQRIVLATKDGPIPGVVGKKPIHLLKPDDRKKVPEMRELHIDIGAADGDEARSLVRIGDVAVIDGDPIELRGGRVISRSMDNRLGCFVAFEAARLVAEAGGAPGDVIAVAAVQEETGLHRCAHGRRTACARASRSPSTSPTRPTRRASRRPRSAATTSAPGPVIERGTSIHPASRSC